MRVLYTNAAYLKNNLYLRNFQISERPVWSYMSWYAVVVIKGFWAELAGFNWISVIPLHARLEYPINKWIKLWQMSFSEFRSSIPYFHWFTFLVIYIIFFLFPGQVATVSHLKTSLTMFWVFFFQVGAKLDFYSWFKQYNLVIFLLLSVISQQSLFAWIIFFFFLALNPRFIG